MRLPARIPVITEWRSQLACEESAVVGSTWTPRVDERLRSIAVDLGVELSVSPLASLPAAALTFGVIAWRVAGVLVAVVVCASVLLSPLFLAPLARSRAAMRRLGELPARCESVARAVRSGVPLRSAVIDLGQGDAVVELRTLGAQVARGRALGEALRELARSAEDESVQLLATALVVGEEAGGDLPTVLDAAADAIRSEQAAATRRRVLIAQSLLSARVLAALPIGFATFVAVATDKPVLVGRLGFAAIIVGGSLNTLGLFWMHVLATRLR